MASLSSSARLGNTSASSLIRSSNSLQAEIATYNDTVARLKFENSAKTSDDLTAYSDYLSGRITSLESTGSVTNGTKALDMRQTLTSAVHSSASADIQRSTISVLDGQGTTDDKLAAIGNAFQRLYSIGDLSAAQSYEQQYYSYYQTVQLQKQTAADALANAAKSSSNNYQSLVTKAEDTIKTNIQSANAAFAAQGPKFLDQATNAYLKTQTTATGSKANGSASIFAALAGQVGMVNKGIQLNGTTKYAQGTYTPGSQLDIYTQAIIADPTHATTYQTKIDSYLNGATNIALPGSGSKSITYNALMNTVYAGNSGNAPYGLVQGADGGWQVAQEHISGYTFGKDQNGATKLMPNYSFFTAGLPNGTKDTLVKAGVNVKQDSNGDYWFQATNQGSFLGKVLGNYPTQGSVQKDGRVEFMTPNGKLYQMVQDPNGRSGLQQLNQFGQIVNANVAGQYGFTPPKTDLTVGKGSTQFMTKVLGDSATPEQIGNKTVYQSNGKLYQLVSDTKGLKGLQEIDKNGKILNSNVAGQYGFNPSTLSRTGGGGGAESMYSPLKGQQFAATLVNAHSQYMNGLTNAQNPNYHTPDTLSHLAAPWLGVTHLVNNALMMQSINQAHNQAMTILQAPVTSPNYQLPVPVAAAPTIVTAPTAQTPLKVAAGSGTSVGQQNTTNPQQATQYTQNVQGVPLKVTGGPSVRLK